MGSPSPKSFGLASLAIGVVCFIHGYVPGFVNDMPSWYLAEGAISCLDDAGVGALKDGCHAYGEPLGYPFLTAGPAFWIASAMVYLPGVSTYVAYIATGALLSALALMGTYVLLRVLDCRPAVALPGAVLFLASPTVLGMQAFIGTFTGFTLLPCYVLADLWAWRVLDEADKRLAALAVVVSVGVKSFALFMDGYSFVAANLVSLCLLVAWATSSKRDWRLRGLGTLFFAVPNLVALGLYSLYVPGSYEANPIEIFRSQGVDLSTLVLPTDVFELPAALNFDSDHTDLWGDGSNSRFNYLGVAVCALAISFLVWARPIRRGVVALAVAGLLALLLSLGPSVKVNDTRPVIEGVPTYESYLMPESAATFSLPWSQAYTTVPGLSSMRASHRWLVVTRFVLILLAALAVERLLRAKRLNALAVVVVALACLELAPNLPLFIDRYRDSRAQSVRFKTDVEPDLARAVNAGERAFFLNYDGSHNDFLANFLAGRASLKAFNAGGDKNHVLASERWPIEVRELAQPDVSPPDVEAALRSGVIDVIIAPYFHLRDSSYFWPPPTDVRSTAEATFAPLKGQPGIETHEFAWFATLRLAE